MIGDSNAMPKRPFADYRIGAEAPRLDVAAHLDVAEELVQGRATKNERQGAEGPIAAQVQRLPSRPIVAEDAAGVKRHNTMPSRPELLIAPAPQAPGREKVVLENRVTIQ